MKIVIKMTLEGKNPSVELSPGGTSNRGGAKLGGKTCESEDSRAFYSLKKKSEEAREGKGKYGGEA